MENSCNTVPRLILIKTILGSEEIVGGKVLSFCREMFKRNCLLTFADKVGKSLTSRGSFWEPSGRGISEVGKSLKSQD